MRKKGISLLLIILVVINVIAGISIYNSRFLLRESKNLFADYEVLYKYLNNHESINSGTIEVNAKYRGAHGENYPNYFNLDYLNETGKVTFSNNSGFLEYSYNNEIQNKINIIKNLKLSDLKKIIKIKNNKIIVDKEQLNLLTNQNFKTVEINFNSHGLIKRIDNIEITLDELKLIKKDRVIEITYNNNLIRITLNSSGYNLNINDILKMNAFINDYKNTYSIIIKDKVFHVEYSDENLIIKALSEGSIYNGMDLIVKKKDNISINKNNILTTDEIPIIRYYSNVDINFWRK